MKEYRNTIYHDALRYDDEHWWKTDDLEFWQRMARESAGNTVLELASGTGRIARHLLNEGFDYTGIEISPEFCHRAREKFRHEASPVEIVQGDIRDFALDRTFDLIFIGFNSFLHMLTDEDAMDCLASVKKHMHAESRFVIDIFIPNPLFLHRPEGHRFPTMEYRESNTGHLITVEESNDYDTDTEVNQIRWYYTDENNRETIYEFSMRMFWPDTMNRLLTDAGFFITNFWGDYQGGDVSEDSHLQIYSCRIA